MTSYDLWSLYYTVFINYWIPQAICEVYKATFMFMWSACHMSHSDTRLICSCQTNLSGTRQVCHVSCGAEPHRQWREAHRMQSKQTEGNRSSFAGWVTLECSSATITQRKYVYTRIRIYILVHIYIYIYIYMELFRVESGPCIARANRTCMPEKYKRFFATCRSDMLVAMCYKCFKKCVLSTDCYWL